MTQVKKPFWKSKTKIGAALLALGPVLVTLGGLISGDLSIFSAGQQLLIEVGAFLAVCGIRDWNIINGIKIK